MGLQERGQDSWACSGLVCGSRSWSRALCSLWASPGRQCQPGPEEALGGEWELLCPPCVCCVLCRWHQRQEKWHLLPLVALLTTPQLLQGILVSHTARSSRVK